MKTNWGDFNFVTVDNIDLQDDTAKLTNLVCVPCETKILTSTHAGVFEGIPSASGFHVIFPYIEAPISQILQEIPELSAMITQILEEISKSEGREENEEDTVFNTESD